MALFASSSFLQRALSRAVFFPVAVSSPSAVTSASSVPPVSSNPVSSAAPFPEPQWSRPLLFGLVSFFVFAQIFFEGMRFGLNAPGHLFSLPMLDVLHSSRGPLSPHLSPVTAAGDAVRALAWRQASPFWWMMARGGEVVGSNFQMFLIVHVLARWWAALAIFRLAERAFGHALTGLLAAALWVGYGDAWPGGAALHHDFLTHSDVALALLLWALVLWSQARATWGLLCGLAACADAPLGLTAFTVLWLATWGTSVVSRPRARSVDDSFVTRLMRAIERRVGLNARAVAWCLAGALPLLAFASRARVFGSEGATSLTTSLMDLARLHAPHATELTGAATGGLWRLVALLGAGWWCWHRAARQSSTMRALSGVTGWIGLAVAVASLLPLLFRATHGEKIVAVEIAVWMAPRIAPLAASLAIVGVAHVLERAMARRGSGGLLAALLLVFGFISVSGPSPLWLLFGLCFIEAAQRADRNANHDPAHDHAISPLAASMRDHGLWWMTGAIAVVACLCAAFPTFALRLTGSPLTWTTVGWMAASLLAWIVTRPQQDRKRSLPGGLFASYVPPPSSASLRKTQIAWNQSWNHLNTSPAADFSRRVARPWQRFAGRSALLIFVLAFGWRARGATGWRLRRGGGLLSLPQPTAWQAAQFWAKNNTAHDALFLATQSGFRAFSRRAVFADPTDQNLVSLSPAFARQWRSRSQLATSLWSTSSASTHAAFTPNDLRLLRARGVTHLVLPSNRLWPRRARWTPLLRRIYSNREWTIYRLEETDRAAT